MRTTDTICAIATPPGRGGVGMVRMSGPAVAAVASAVIDGLPEARHARLVRFTDADGEVIDTGIALYFPGPASFTGEDVLELHAHGSPVVLEALVSACVAAGARRAGPGEFTQRAYLNDKLDLAQAEAVADLIDAGSRQAARAARRSLEGVFSQKVTELAEAVTELRVWVEAALDFPDEDVDFLADGQVETRVTGLIGRTRDLIDKARAGRLLTDGIRIAIVGRPNAGKSSLFNALARREAAIVTEVPGTTRDVVRETVVLAGVPATLADTAGLRETGDRVEAEGVRRATAELETADLVFWVTDSTDEQPGAAPEASAPMIRIDNKIDLSGLPAGRHGNAVALSAKTGAGLEVLDARVRELLALQPEGDGEFSARARQVEALERARAHLEAGAAELVSTGSGELLAEELRRAADDLGEITGRLTSDELLGRIFSSFCIGK